MRVLIFILSFFLAGGMAEPTDPLLVISKQEMTLSLIGGDGAVIKTYPIACAINKGNKQRRGDNKTPEGTFKVTQILDGTYMTHDFGDGKGPIRGCYGPWFFRLNVPGFPKIGIHGTHLPESIGTRCTEGCIRLHNEDLLELKEYITIGMTVIILPDADDGDEEL